MEHVSYGDPLCAYWSFEESLKLGGLSGLRVNSRGDMLAKFGMLKTHAPPTYLTCKMCRNANHQLCTNDTI